MVSYSLSLTTILLAHDKSNFIYIQPVETRKFGISEYFIEDLRNSRSDAAFQSIYTPDYQESMADVKRYCNRAIAKPDFIPNTFYKKQLNVALGLISACSVGTGVLVFVSGMAEINLFEARLKKDRRVKFVAIHSDLPTDSENSALVGKEPHHIRVIVATNAAESSITLPDVDVVICLGTYNAESYDSSQFSRIQLTNSWVSKPSAQQRAGRTGRMRPGTVYHLYTRQLYDEVFSARNPSAVRSKPLHDVVLKVLSGLGDFYGSPTITELLGRMIEAPNLQSIQSSLDNLHQGNTQRNS